MASKRRLRRKGCSGKVVYFSQPLAIEACREMGYKRGERGLHPYRCNFCSTPRQARFHIGHHDESRYAA